jgi:hypothetical protein
VRGRARRTEVCLRRLLLACLLLIPAGTHAITLREAFERAGPADGYDKYVVLEPGATYTGGLLIGPIFSPIAYGLEGEEGKDVRIVGNGAILDLQGGQICISYCVNRLDIDDCIVLRGNIRFRGINTADDVALPTGSVRHVTFYKPHDYGIRLQGSGDGITLERNLVVDAVDTGWDYVYMTGISNSWLPTGTNISFSGQYGWYGTPVVRENWSYQSDPVRNANPLAHFSRLCEYG